MLDVEKVAKSPEQARLIASVLEARRTTGGYVYFVQCGTDGPIKIGYTSDPAKRLSGLQVGSPEQLYMLGAVRARREVEGALHQALSKYRIGGEWFEPSAAILIARAFIAADLCMSMLEATNETQLTARAVELAKFICEEDAARSRPLAPAARAREST